MYFKKLEKAFKNLLIKHNFFFFRYPVEDASARHSQRAVPVPTLLPRQVVPEEQAERGGDGLHLPQLQGGGEPAEDPRRDQRVRHDGAEVW